jgi:transcriptional regulator with XRE-family HTH domain
LRVATAQDVAKTPPARRRIDVHVGGRISNKRLERGLREHDLANLIHAPVATISDYENGSSRVDAQHLLQFGSLLGVSVAFFFDGT